MSLLCFCLCLLLWRVNVPTAIAEAPLLYLQGWSHVVDDGAEELKKLDHCINWLFFFWCAGSWLPPEPCGGWWSRGIEKTGSLHQLTLFLLVCWVLIAAWAFLQLRWSGLLSGCRVRASPCSGCSCFQARALRRADFSSYGSWAQWWRLRGSRSQAQQSGRTGLVAPR